MQRNEDRIKQLIRITENLIETIIQEDHYRSSNKKESVNLMAFRRRHLMQAYNRAKSFALSDAVLETKKSFPFLFNRLKYLNSKLLKLALKNSNDGNPLIEISPTEEQL